MKRRRRSSDIQDFSAAHAWLGLGLRGQTAPDEFEHEEDGVGLKERRKGAMAENELAGLLTERLGEAVKRRLGQERDGGSDIHVGGVAVQVKRQERASLPTWMQQAMRDCPNGMRAAVAWRRSREGWVVAMPLDDWCALVRDALADDAE